ncbi:phage integrase SAM-like domain-containing protein [uncultured Bacteroides sp.]|uniref:tyrosine-type recombinase/integrase n=1 Tax=uncultured Bacteroides sp. TaxID=162156 RepID=UPI0027DBA000|nr:phage integrase SAM-like domain-containing protein [uncultured Bacteroides sp.]
MLTIKAEVQRDKQRSDGTYNVKVRFTQDRKVKRLSSSLFVTSKDLTKSFNFKEGTTVKREVDKLIQTYQEKCAKLQLEVNHYTLDDIFSFLKSEREQTQSIDFIQYCKEWLETTGIKGKKNYQSALNSFISYLGKEHLKTDEVTSQLLNGFKVHLNLRREKQVIQLQKQGKRIPSNRTVSLYLGSIRHLFNEAKKKYNDYDKNIILIPHSPFEHVEVPKQEATRKRALSAETINQILKLPYIRNANGKERICPFNLAKDCFILSFCLMGMNSVDLHSCDEIENNAITYYRSKTTGRRLDKAKMKVDILPVLSSLMEKYKDHTGRRVFRFYQMYNTANNFNRAINLGLKQIGKMLQVDDLEFYAARHSWATIALNKVGIDKYTVHAALNHVDETMRVTDIYIERDFVNENKANAKVVKYVFGRM